MYKKIRSLDYDQKPSWYNLVNRAWRMLYPAGGEVVLSKDRLIRAARKNTGFTDFGKGEWEEPLEKMLDAINHEAELNPIGRFITKKRLENLLSIRLRAEWWFRHHPEILDRPLYPVLLIIGLQRTGTTKLQRLLSIDPDIRSLKSWEAINPVPLNQHANESALRIRQAKISEKALKFLSPNFFGIHPVEHLEPEEDILLLDVSFMSTTAEATMHVPSYASWLEKRDQHEAYEYAVKLLKFLQFQRPAVRWVLKSPHHLEFLDLAERHFGNVHFLWTHRNVYESIPSFISMMIHSRSVFSDAVDPHVVRDHWLRKNRYMLEKAIRYRNAAKGRNLFTDIFYKPFLDDPMATMKKIYGRTGSMDKTLELAFRKAATADHRQKYGQHIYSVDSFGMTKKMIDSFTGEYQAFIQKLQHAEPENIRDDRNETRKI